MRGSALQEQRRRRGELEAAHAAREAELRRALERVHARAKGGGAGEPQQSGAQSGAAGGGGGGGGGGARPATSEKEPPPPPKEAVRPGQWWI